MNPKKEGRRPELDLELNLSPPRATASPPQSPPLSSLSSMKPSPPSSCVSWELGQGDDGGDSSPLAEAAAGQMMVVVGCPRCLMYVMLAEEDCPKCPVCKSTVLLRFLP
ncbi:unnamed protein product [Cuscuta campestris]|uniref:GIR1-like zinc ribbon domain-containing protein n=2 Tax=Cuscuta sect. Cleistogrammica TaxID=1824901 RepID=A0A484N5Z0_9ASTE|nr:hypothetical protein DM860_006137 [Cuscuta australis]VFQ95394.1 unnamed protein product [Cuscuta campestris]